MISIELNSDQVISWADSIRISKNVKEEFGIHEYES